jgi:hypothetical protein
LASAPFASAGECQVSLACAHAAQQHFVQVGRQRARPATAPRRRFGFSDVGWRDLFGRRIAVFASAIEQQCGHAAVDDDHLRERGQQQRVTGERGNPHLLGSIGVDSRQTHCAGHEREQTQADNETVD